MPEKLHGLQLRQAVVPLNQADTQPGRIAQLGKNVFKAPGPGVLRHEQEPEQPGLLLGKEDHLHPELLEGRRIMHGLFREAVKALHGGLAQLPLHLLHALKHGEDGPGRAAQTQPQLPGCQRLCSIFAHQRQRGGNDLFFCKFRLWRHLDRPFLKRLF